MLGQDVHVKIQHIYREANMAANWLSKYGHSITGTMSTIQSFDIELRNIVKDDVIGRILVRRSA